MHQTLLSPDGKTVVKFYQQNLNGRLGGVVGPFLLVQLWDVASGKELP